LKYLFLIPLLFVTSVEASSSQAEEIALPDRRASELAKGYAFKILKPIPRHNNGCDTVFRNGKALDSCDGNFGMDPEIYGGAVTFCKWNFYTVYDPNHSDEKQKWSVPFSSDEVIRIRSATDEWKVENVRETIYGRLRHVESVKNRHIQIQFSHSEVGQFICYAGYLKQFRKNSDYYFGATEFKWNESSNEPVYSGLSIADIQRQLGSYVEIIKQQ
jgi:hypothetical protein